MQWLNLTLTFVALLGLAFVLVVLLRNWSRTGQICDLLNEITVDREFVRSQREEFDPEP